MPMLSRVADALLWMSRYLERGEHTARLLDLQLHLMLEAPDSAADRWRRIFDSLYIDVPDADWHAPYALTKALAFTSDSLSSVAGSITSARENARHVRELISSEMWEQVNRMYLQVQNSSIDDIWSEPHSFFRSIKEGIHTFQGITDSTMNHGEGWQFIQIGRSLERTSAIARLLRCHYAYFADTPMNDTVGEDYLEWIGLLKSATAFEAYCKVYTADLRPAWIGEFLMLDAEFPHSIRFSVNSLTECLQAIEAATDSRRGKTPSRLAGRLRAELEFAQMDELIAAGLGDFLLRTDQQCEQLHAAIYHAYISYPVQDVVPM
jgi:uncharacterized alpha-E superfamily protein